MIHKFRYARCVGSEEVMVCYLAIVQWECNARG